MVFTEGFHIYLISQYPWRKTLQIGFSFYRRAKPGNKGIMSDLLKVALTKGQQGDF